MLIKGIDLNDRQRQEVLSSFVYRWTTENGSRATAWAGKDTPQIPLISDDEWLTNYAFHFVADGSRLSCTRTHCEPVYMAADEGVAS